MSTCKVSLLCGESLWKQLATKNSSPQIKPRHKKILATKNSSPQKKPRHKKNTSPQKKPRHKEFFLWKIFEKHLVPKLIWGGPYLDSGPDRVRWWWQGLRLGLQPIWTQISMDHFASLMGARKCWQLSLYGWLCWYVGKSLTKSACALSWSRASLVLWWGFKPAFGLQKWREASWMQPFNASSLRIAMRRFSQWRVLPGQESYVRSQVPKVSPLTRSFKPTTGIQRYWRTTGQRLAQAPYRWTPRSARQSRIGWTSAMVLRSKRLQAVAMTCLSAVVPLVKHLPAPTLASLDRKLCWRLQPCWMMSLARLPTKPS